MVGSSESEPLLERQDPEEGGEERAVGGDGGAVDAKPSDQTIVVGEPSGPQEKVVVRGASIGSPGVSAVRRIYRRLLSTSRFNSITELQRFQNSLLILGLDHSTTTRLVCSWGFFIVFTAVVPVLGWVYVSCDNCDDFHSHPYQQLVDCSESALGVVSFLSLAHILRKYGLKKVLLLDKINNDSVDVRVGYEQELHDSFKVLAYILLPCTAVQVAHKIWWFSYVLVELPFMTQPLMGNILLFLATVVAWLYKSSVFLFVCLLFRLMCSLQLLRLQGYIKLLEETSDVSTILKEHMRIRDQLLMISHRYRMFVILSMFTITFSQLTSLFVITDSHGTINFFRAGDLIVCSIVQLSGFCLCIHGAAKITHRAQRIMSIVSQWHAVATCSPRSALFMSEDLNSPSHPIGPAHPLLYNDSNGDFENVIHVATGNASQAPHDVVAFQQRQALMDYLQFANAGISLYGFVLDRGFLFAVFGIEFSLTLFILGKTILTH